MTLKEKFKNILFGYEIAREQSKINRCEIISDDFAIGFSVWIEENYPKGIDTSRVNMFLETYKKEKGL